MVVHHVPGELCGSPESQRETQATFLRNVNGGVHPQLGETREVLLGESPAVVVRGPLVLQGKPPAIRWVTHW